MIDTVVILTEGMMPFTKKIEASPVEVTETVPLNTDGKPLLVSKQHKRLILLSRSSYCYSLNKILVCDSLP